MTGTPGPVIGSVCTGYGGLDLGVLAALGGGRIAWCADPDPHITQILATRMPGVPNHGDIRALDWASVEPVDVLVAGFPCQDISAAGKRAGIERGERSGVWTDIVAGIRVLRPALIVVENVAALRWKNGGLHRVLGDLAATGYDAAWRSVRASDIGAPHRRERVFLLAWRRAIVDDRPAAHPDRARRNLQRIQRSATTGGPFPAGPVAGVANAGSFAAERLRGPGAVVGPEGAATGPRDQRERHGHALVDRGATPADPDRAGRQELHPRRPERRPVSPSRGAAPSDTTSLGHRNQRTPRGQRVPTTAVPASPPTRGPERSAADAASNGRHEGLPGPAWFEGRSDVAVGSDGDAGAHHPPVDWGIYTPAIHRWEQVLGRHTPHPTELGRHGRPVLGPAFVEHLMGLPPGWVTALPIPRTAQLRALGNGVVPQQAEAAYAALLDDLADLCGNFASDASKGRARNAS
ncbi:DNA cytosine methyltransferase [Kutzneria sp. NPDC051319]|uniref:DNA cytosine methyltransferase n=1 Tax=Kutzneria sp. NPDC051319 TaxID=3155047 RepID=UPI00343A1D0A